VTACKNSVMFGPTPWTGIITQMSEYAPLSFGCSRTTRSVADRNSGRFADTTTAHSVGAFSLDFGG
jgi:hypothetical protein